MKNPAALAVILVSLAACGGGGGAAPAAPAASLKITANNAAIASAAAYEAATQSVGLGDLVGTSGLLAAAPVDSASVAARQFSKIGRNTLFSVPVGPETQSCAQSGTLTISGNISNPLTLSQGDSFSVVADRCDDGLGNVIHGALGFTVDQFSGDLFTGLYNLQMTMNLTDFQVTTPGDAVTSNGAATVLLDTSTAGFVSATVSGSSLTTDSNLASISMTNFESTQTVDTRIAPAPYTWAASGTLDTTRLSGIVSYSTPATFEGSGADYPGIGELLVRGDNSTARLVALNNVDVRIEIDSNADGEVDETIVTTWAEFSD